MGVPLSTNLQSTYSTAFNAGLGSGLKVSDNFSLWLDFNLEIYNSKNNQATHNNDFSLIEAAFWARYRILDSDLSPFFFAGPGISYNEYRSNQGAVLDPNTGYGYIPINSYEFDFLAEGGLGVDLRMAQGMTAYLQGKLTYDFASAAFAGYGSTDSPIIVMPFELGIIFGI